MSDGLRPKDLRYVDKIKRSNKQSVKRKENLKYRAKQRAFKSRSKKEEAESRWNYYQSPKEQLDWALTIARHEIAEFMKRTGRSLSLGRTHHHMRRQGLTVMDVITGDLKKPRSWLTLQFTPGHRRMLHQRELRYACVKLRVEYWREMRTREQMAALLILAWMDGITPEEDVGGVSDI